MTPPTPAATASAYPPPPSRWSRLSAASVRGFHSYANWLIGISWWRFLLLALALMVMSGIAQNLPPFSWKWTRTIHQADAGPSTPELPAPPAPPRPPDAGASTPTARPALPAPPAAPQPPSTPRERAPARHDGLEITIDGNGVRIVGKPKAAADAASATDPAAPAASDTASAVDTPPAPAEGKPTVITIQVPEGPQSEGVREAVAEARQAIEEALQEARDEAEAARGDADAARAEAKRAVAKAKRAGRQVETVEVSMGEHLPMLAMLWIVASAIIKITYKKQVQAEAQAAQAVETAEAESLRRQVLEARMAAMQAQVEPHFLFNTLASIDHLIEVDPARASQMQKNLIALLRASMPTLREADGGSARDLGRELAVIRPYLEILKVRMEERLATEIDVPEGLESAEFPAMMLQTLVENAVKHGLEPKPEGGLLRVKAEILHGKLALSVADTGLGFGRAATAGTGVGLANIRERLKLLYGGKAALTIAENPGGGTRATITVPYRPLPHPQEAAA